MPTIMVIMVTCRIPPIKNFPACQKRETVLIGQHHTQYFLMEKTKKAGFFQSEDWIEFRDKILDPREVFEQMVFLLNIFYLCHRVI
jgi:hypothetical protein